MKERKIKPVDPKQDPDDGLTVTQNEDGSYALSWDDDDPRWAMFNNMSQEDLEKIIVDYNDDNLYGG